jgi:hypothetical protein
MAEGFLDRFLLNLADGFFLLVLIADVLDFFVCLLEAFVDSFLTSIAEWFFYGFI